MNKDVLLYAETLDDFERARIAMANRIRSLSEIGYEDLSAQTMLNNLSKLEAEATKGLQKAITGHPLGPWVTAQAGVGAKQAGRLLAVIGNPAWHVKEERPRKLSELWSYCGYGDAKQQVRRRGQQGNWNPVAKMRVHLIAAACIRMDGKPDKNGRSRARSPYRDVYDDAREYYKGSVHPEACVRCGPSGKPAPAGSKRSDGHLHAIALRAVCKEILRDLWIEANKLAEVHEPAESC